MDDHKIIIKKKTHKNKKIKKLKVYVRPAGWSQNNNKNKKHIKINLKKS